MSQGTNSTNSTEDKPIDVGELADAVTDTITSSVEIIQEQAYHKFLDEKEDELNGRKAKLQELLSSCSSMIEEAKIHVNKNPEEGSFHDTLQHFTDRKEENKDELESIELDLSELKNARENEEGKFAAEANEYANKKVDAAKARLRSAMEILHSTEESERQTGEENSGDEEGGDKSPAGGSAFVNNEQSAIEDVAKQLKSLLLKGKDAKYDQLLADYKNLLEKGASDLEPVYLAVEKLSEQLKALGSIQNKGLSTLLGVDPKKAEEGKETLNAEHAQQVGLIRQKQVDIQNETEKKGEGYDEMLKSELGKHLSVGVITLSTPDVHSGKRKYNEFMKGTKLKFAPVSTEADEAS